MADQQQISRGAKSIFLQALQFKDPRERAAFLDAACASSPVDRDHVEQLLDAVREEASDPLQQAAEMIATQGMSRYLIDPDCTGTSRSPSETLPLPAPIGPYTLVRVIGEGGMGIVYLAEQSHPVRRKVALKVIKPGMDSDQFSARFESERQTLSMMDHPHIARLLDVGTTDQGRPYFAMELVCGLPITTYCRQHGLSILERLELFCDVCDAIGHAHQKGVIHRDLKPSNLLVQPANAPPPSVPLPMQDQYGSQSLSGQSSSAIPLPEHHGPGRRQEALTGSTHSRRGHLPHLRRTEFRFEEDDAGNGPSTTPTQLRDPSERPVVKVIDFGIAKAVHSLVDNATRQFTGLHGFIGTPMYVSPEQIDPETTDVDTRSDVYSLGVVLYELLAEVPPYDPVQMQRSTLDELKKLICKDDPPRPSTQVLKASQYWEEDGISVGRTSPATDGPAEHRDASGDPVEKQLVEVSDTECLLGAAAPSGDVHSRLGPDQARERSRRLRRELDWIVMRAMEKDRQRRYQSPREFAEDIRRFLDGDPVLACPPSTWYRLRKLAGRHRTALLATMLILLSLIAGLSSAVRQAVRAVEAERLAELRLLETQENRLEIQQLLYAGDVELAALAWQRNDIGRMRELLANQIPTGSDRPDFRGFEWHLLWKQAGVKTRELLAVEQPLYCVCLCPHGELLATSGADARIYLLDTERWEVVRTIETGQVEVNHLHFSPDGTRLASAGDDGTIALWDPWSGKELFRFGAHDDMVFGIRFTADGEKLVSCSAGTVAKIWRVRDGALEGTIEYHENRLETLDVSSRGHLALASRDQRSTVWMLTDGDLLWEDRTWHPSTVSSVHFSMDGQFLAQGQIDGMLSLFAVGPPKEVLARQMLSSGVHSVGISPDARYVIAGDNVGMLHLFPIDMYGGAAGLSATATVPRERIWQAHDKRIYALAVLPDNERIVSASRDGRLVLSMPLSSSGITVVDVPALDFVIPNDETIVTSGPEAHRVRLRPGPAAQPIAGTAGIGTRELTLARLSRDPFLIQGERTVCLVPDEGPLQPVYAAPDGQAVNVLAASPEGQRVAMVVVSGSERDVLLLYDRFRQQELWRVQVQSTHCVEFTLDGRGLAYGFMNDVRIADTLTGEIEMVLEGHQGGVQAMALLPDGRHLATGSEDRMLKVWDLHSGEEAWSVVAHENRVDAVAAHPDGETIVTAGRDGMLRFWRWRLRRMACELPAVKWSVGRLAITPDGSRMISNHNEQGLLIYDGTPVRLPVDDR